MRLAYRVSRRAEAATTPRPWTMLGVSMGGQIAGTVANNSVAALIPYLTREQGLTLGHAGVLAAAPLAGTMVSLVAWGVLVDRVGERIALAAGLAVVTAAAAAAALVAAGDPTAYVGLALCWFLIGVGAASTNSASGRLVVGWFPAHRRGTAMGIRQTGLPLGVGIAAILIPQLAQRLDLAATMAVIAVIAAVAAATCWLLVVDPPRPDRASAADAGHLENPYRRDHRLLRIHLASMLLVVPQFTVWTFMLVWLVDAKSWTALAAGVAVALTQLLGAASRIGVGWWSDRVGSRLRPMRQVAIAATVTMLALGLLEPTPAAVALIVVATAVTVADNGLAFTAVAEIGGPYWSGKAMGWQNTGQYLVSTAVPPLVGATITGFGYPVAFAAVAVFPLVAIAVVPVARRTDVSARS